MDKERARASRQAEEYISAVLEDVGLGGAAHGHKHLVAEELAALVELVRRKAAAFWVNRTPRTAMLGFRRGIVTAGLPARGKPLRLKSAEAGFVRKDVDAGAAAGQCVRGMSPRGSWACPATESVSGRRQRMVMDYRSVNPRTLTSRCYVRRFSDVKGELVGQAFLPGAPHAGHTAG